MAAARRHLEEIVTKIEARVRKVAGHTGRAKLSVGKRGNNTHQAGGVLDAAGACTTQVSRLLLRLVVCVSAGQWQMNESAKVPPKAKGGAFLLKEGTVFGTINVQPLLPTLGRPLERPAAE